jgi:ADP-heptose:LPS heptosyltransferase
MNIKQTLRHLILDHLGKREDRFYWRQPQTEFDIPHNGTLCLWQPDGKLGDSVIHTILLNNLHKQRPDIKVVVMCAPSLTAFWALIPGVWKALPAPSASNTKKAIQDLNCHVNVFISLEAFASIDTLRFMAALKPVISIGLSVGRYKAFTYSLADTTYEFPRKHVTERLRNLCALMRLNYEPDTALPLVAKSQLTERVTLSQSEPSLFLNVFGAGPQKAFTSATIDWLIQIVKQASPEMRLILNVPEDQRDAISKRLNLQPNSAMMLAPPKMSIWELSALMQQCRAVITPDTAIGHIAAAMDLPLTVLFEDAHYTPVVWPPLTKHLQIVSPTRNGNVNNFDPRQAEARLLAMLNQARLARHATAI